MENVRSDAFAFTRKKAAGFFVYNDKTRRIGTTDLLVGVVDTGAGVEIEEIAIDNDRTVRAVMVVNSSASSHVKGPNDVTVGCVDGNELGGVFGSLMARFV